MTKLQFRVLYRQFLFRVVDLELLSSHAQGDARKILGQFAAMLIVASVWLSPVLIGISLSSAPGTGLNNISLVFFMVVQHFLIATTMLVVGLFAVLSWDSTFPDKRDVLVLSPLPLGVRTIFLAKVAAVATSLGVTIVLLHSAVGLVLPAVFATHAAPTVLPALTFDATPVPVPARDIEAVMDRDLRQQLTKGALAPGTGAGLAIGVWKNGERRVFTYRAAKPDSLFEIGSISKTFTGLTLARMVTEGKVRLDEPVRNLLPVGTVSKPEGQEITLLDLTTHHSGLPPLPDNVHPADESNPYSDYGTQQLYAYMAKHGVRKPDDAPFAYSSLGVGLLAQALAERAGSSYPDQLREEITDPLGMTDTVVQLSAEQQQRFLQGYDEKHRPVHALHVDALAPAGAILSTPVDMLTYLAANLHPETYPPLSGALSISHRLHDRAPLGQQIALGWVYAPDTGTYWHNGATAGFTSYAFFSPRANCAAVVLMNSGPNLLLAPDLIAVHIAQRLDGPAGHLA